MSDAKKYIDALISSESVFKAAGKLALELRDTTEVKSKGNTGLYAVDVVTEADLKVQEMILGALAGTRLSECTLIAEESTPAVAKFSGVNPLRLTLDPIDGTENYTLGKNFFSVIVSLHDDARPLYTFQYYPVFDWVRRITDDGIHDEGVMPDVPVNQSIDLSKTIVFNYGDPEHLASDMYAELSAKGYVFRDRRQICEDAGATMLLFIGKVGGFYVGEPLVYDGLPALHYGQAKGLKVISSVDMSRIVSGKFGPHYPGWYFVLNTPGD